MSIESTSSDIKGSKRLWAICRAAERGEIAKVLEEFRQNRTHAAMALGISRRTLLNKIKQYGLTPAICREIVVQLPQLAPQTLTQPVAN